MTVAPSVTLKVSLPLDDAARTEQLKWRFLRTISQPAVLLLLIRYSKHYHHSLVIDNQENNIYCIYRDNNLASTHIWPYLKLLTKIFQKMKYFLEYLVLLDFYKVHNSVKQENISHHAYFPGPISVQVLISLLNYL